jgi:hypothetical protein
MGWPWKADPHQGHTAHCPLPTSGRRAQKRTLRHQQHQRPPRQAQVDPSKAKNINHCRHHPPILSDAMRGTSQVRLDFLEGVLCLGGCGWLLVVPPRIDWRRSGCGLKRVGAARSKSRRGGQQTRPEKGTRSLGQPKERLMGPPESLVDVQTILHTCILFAGSPYVTPVPFPRTASQGSTLGTPLPLHLLVIAPRPRLNPSSAIPYSDHSQFFGIP